MSKQLSAMDFPQRGPSFLHPHDDDDDDDDDDEGPLIKTQQGSRSNFPRGVHVCECVACACM